MTAEPGLSGCPLSRTVYANGSKQVTYAGHPLYRFADDMKRGQTRGEGSHEFGAGWDALTPPVRRSNATAKTRNESANEPHEPLLMAPVRGARSAACVPRRKRDR